MKVMADLSVIPLGVGVSLSSYIAECEAVLERAGLRTRLHAFGTNIEGEWEAVMEAVRACHEVLHSKGVSRISTTLRISTRSDRVQTMEDRIASVTSKKPPAQKPPQEGGPL
jgi:uncharacterized protein (TIGR00106 family)